MILHDLNAIFIHVPKTAGNYLTRHHFHRYSDDFIVVRGHQDGVERFEIRGEVTTRKHMTLAEYANVLDLSDYYVVTALRDPVERMISAYFSPHRRFRLNARGRIAAVAGRLLGLDVDVGARGYTERPIEFDAGGFRAFIDGQECLSDYLDGYAKSRGLFLLRNESLEADLGRFLASVGGGHSLRAGGGPRVNKAGVELTASQREECRRLVRGSRHERDYAYLERLERDAGGVKP